MSGVARLRDARSFIGRLGSVVLNVVAKYRDAVRLFIGAIVYTAREAIRIPSDDKLYFARANFTYWQGIENEMQADGFRGVPRSRMKANFAHASTVSAFCFLWNFRTHCRFATVAISAALSLCVAWWINAVLHHEDSLKFALISLLVISIGVMVLIPIGVVAGKVRVRPLFIVGVIVLVVAAKLLGSLSAPWELLKFLSFGFVSSSIVGLSLLAFALGLATGVLFLALAVVGAEVFVQVRRYRMYSREVALVLSAEIVSILRDVDGGVRAAKRTDIVKYLMHIARCLRYKPVEGGRYVDLLSRNVVNQRFRAASNAILDYQSWISLQQKSTVADLKVAMVLVVEALSSEMYHYLPVGATRSESVRGRSFIGVVLHYATKLTVAGIPLIATLIVIPALGIGIPGTLNQWITGIGVILLLGQLIALLDPSLSWREFGELLNASRKSSPGDRAP